MDFLKEYAASDISRLHMPGHKGRAPMSVPAPLKEMYRYDITEIGGADNLYAPEGIIAESEANAGDIFGAETFYSTEGSSLAIKAMLWLSIKHREKNFGVFKAGQKPIVLTFGKSHKAFYHAAELLNLEIVKCDLHLKNTLKIVESHVIGAYITYPDYFGNTADIKALKTMLSEYDIPLLADGAHSAYFKFLDAETYGEYRHPIDLGADICCTSAHKTLPALTGAAYLHIADSFKNIIPDVKHAFDLFGSSSPSYLIMASLDAFNGIADEYKEELKTACEKVSKLKKNIEDMGFCVAKSDPMRIVVNADDKFTGEDFAKALRSVKCEPECFDRGYVIMMLSPYNRAIDLERIGEAFRLLKEGKIDLSAETSKGYDCLGTFN